MQAEELPPWYPFVTSRSFAFVVLFLFLLGIPAVSVWAHPPPETVVTGFFTKGSPTIRFEVEVDARCLLVPAKPEEELYVLHWYLQKMTEAETTDWMTRVHEYLAKTVELRLLPGGRIEPRFEFRFTTLGGGPLDKLDDPVMLRGTWEITVPNELTGYQLKALKDGEVAVMFRNQLDGKPVERISSLFPGEESYVLDVSAYSAASSASPVSPPDSNAPGRGKMVLLLALILVLGLGGWGWKRRGTRI